MLLVPSLASGGAERVTSVLAARWLEQGWDVMVATLSSEADDAYHLEPRVRRLALDLIGVSTSMLSALFANWRRVRAVRRAISEHRPDVVLAMMSSTCVLLALARRGKQGPMLIGSERVYPPQMPLGRAWEALRACSYSRLDVVVGQTARAKAWLESHTTARRVVVIPNAVAWPLPDSGAAIAPGSVGGSGRRRLLAVGRLDRQKGFDRLIEAFAAVAASHLHWDLVIVGEGPERAELESQIRHAGVAGRAWLPGRAGNLAEWYATADLFALSSRFEGFPNVLLEAMSHGLPAVAFDCEAGPAEIIRSGVDGRLVPDGDIAAFGVALSALMSDDARRATMSARALEVRERFSMEAVLEQWRALLTERAKVDV